MARDLPRVTEQLDPRPHSSLSKALPMPKLVVGVCTPTSRTPTAPPPLLTAAPAEPRLGLRYLFLGSTCHPEPGV